MAQAFPRFCPRCGVAAARDQRSCANCGLVFPTADQLPPFQLPSTIHQSEQIGIASPPHVAATPRKRRFSRGGCLLIALLLLILIGVGSYVGAGLAGISLPGFAGGSNGTQAPITTTQLNETVPYAGVTLTVLDVQQAQNFADDPQSSNSGMIRLHLQEKNSTQSQISWLYTDIAHLLLPDKSAVAPNYVKARVGIAPGAAQTSIVDFAVPTSTNISQLTLRLGTGDEAQMDIPLNGKTDLSKYAPQTTNLNGHVAYFGLDWTLTGATTQLSIAGQQASKGMHYLVLALSIDNTLSQTAILGSPYDYIRLQAGNTTLTPKDSTFPTSFDASVTGKTGTVTFLIPQNSSTFTLLFLSQKQSGFDQSSLDFRAA